MKFLLDMGISRRVAPLLRRDGRDAVHLFDEGLGRSPDAEVREKARVEGRILLTHDLDFADLLAASGARLPSVVLFRLSDVRPDSVLAHLLRVLTECRADLEHGAIISITDRRVRVRTLPITAFSPSR